MTVREYVVVALFEQGGGTVEIRDLITAADTLDALSLMAVKAHKDYRVCGELVEVRIERGRESNADRPAEEGH